MRPRSGLCQISSKTAGAIDVASRTVRFPVTAALSSHSSPHVSDRLDSSRAAEGCRCLLFIYPYMLTINSLLTEDTDGIKQKLWTDKFNSTHHQQVVSARCFHRDCILDRVNVREPSRNDLMWAYRGLTHRSKLRSMENSL